MQVTVASDCRTAHPPTGLLAPETEVANPIHTNTSAFTVTRLVKLPPGIRFQTWADLTPDQPRP